MDIWSLHNVLKYIGITNVKQALLQKLLLHEVTPFLKSYRIYIY